MIVSRGRASKLSEMLVDTDLDFLSTYQVKNLAAPAATEALRKGSKDVTNAEVSNTAAIVRTKLNFGSGLVNADIAVGAALALAKLASTVLTDTQIATLISNHAGLVTVHQDAPALIATHAGDSEAHHNVVNNSQAGDSLIASADAVQSTESEYPTYVKVKEIKCGRLNGGVLRVKFDLRTADVSAMAYGRVYRNGAAVGTEQTNTSTGYVVKSEDIAGWSEGDLIQLYLCIAPSTYWALAQNFRLYELNIPDCVVITD